MTMRGSLPEARASSAPLADPARTQPWHRVSLMFLIRYSRRRLQSPARSPAEPSWRTQVPLGLRVPGERVSELRPQLDQPPVKLPPRSRAIVFYQCKIERVRNRDVFCGWESIPLIIRPDSPSAP